MKPYRVLQITSINIYSGVASVVMNLYRYMDKSKIQFDFMTWNIEPGNNYQSEIEIMGGRIYELPYYKVDLSGFCKRIDQIMKSGDYQMVHAHESVISLLPLYYARKRHIPYRIAHSHNPTMETPIKNKIVALCRPLFKKYATNFFACSVESGDFLFGVKADTHVLNNAIDTKKFSYHWETREKVRKQLGLEDSFVVGNVGRLCLQKNQSFLIDIFYELQKEKDNAKLIIVGEGELREELEGKVNGYNIADKVLFLGLRKDIDELYQAMDVFILSSLFEGLGLVLVEAQCSGLTCFMSDTVNKKVKVSDYIYEMSIKENPKSWAREILSCTFNNNERGKGSEYVKFHGYALEETSKQMLNFYLDRCEA
ncbi:glycosyltransferase [Lacrimispora indolis]|uniref:glycosyltransferase n=1 Tax=Lacrimispora indolis TaxID=69825 RepID=UPI000405625A|nr:glycosyltransferase [[Clostridium] methoxybenzovorans]